FPSLLIGSDNDPACTAWRACDFAQAWSSQFHLLSAVGHINADSRLGDWEAGLVLLKDWLEEVLPLAASSHAIRWAA
ncbi:MAG: alpha/beta hydrolase, partial [Pedobacter sp.]|nr:alpha/beta hydrolase [Pedobacter sp.]